MAFNPDIYLQEQMAKGDKSAAKMGFDPDAYLSRGPKAAPNRGNIINSDVPTVVGERPNAINPVERELPRSAMDQIAGVVEPVLTMATGAVAQPAGALYGLVKNATSPEFGTQQGIQNAERTGGEFANRFTYQPRSRAAQENLGTIAEVADALKIPAYTPVIGELPSLAQSLRAGSQVARPLAREAVEAVKPIVAPVVERVKPSIARLADALRAEPEPTMSGVGSAQVPMAETRVQTAKQLRVPIDLSKGQATKDLGQQQFEIETMKTYPEDVGRPLILAQELRNKRIGENLDAYIDATGAKVANEFYLRPTGEVVDSALRETANKAKTAYKNAYNTARASEEGQQIVNVSGIINKLNDMEAEAVNAPVIDSAKIKLQKLAPNGEISLNDIEEVRKMVNRLSGDSPSNMAFGGDIKKMIDSVTENAGGDLFKEARRLRTKFANEFENVGLIDDLLKTKPNSNDRVVALEKVFDHAIIQSDLDSLSSLGRVLKKTEPGRQAWRELQGQTVEHLRSAITKNIETDSTGQRTFNPKQFDTIVKNLDKSGKLDYLFGKSGAQEIRDLRDTTIAVNSQPKGINSSNTASAMNKVLNGIIKRTLGKVPVGGQMVEAAAEAIEKRKIAKQVEESLDYNPKDAAKQLRKGNK